MSAIPIYTPPAYTTTHFIGASKSKLFQNSPPAQLTSLADGTTLSSAASTALANHRSGEAWGLFEQALGKLPADDQGQIQGRHEKRLAQMESHPIWRDMSEDEKLAKTRLNNADAAADWAVEKDQGSPASREVQELYHTAETFLERHAELTDIQAKF